MFNLVNGELFKLHKSRGFFTCCIAVIIFIIFMYSCVKIADEYEKKEISKAEAEGQVVELELERDGEEPIEIIDMEEMMLSAVAGIFLAIFASIFVTGEYGNGAVKNIIGKGFTREKIFLAKYVVTILAIIIMFLMISLVTLLCGLLFMGAEGVDAEFVKSLCRYGGMQLLFEIGFVSLVILVGEVSRSVGISVSVSLGLIMLAHLVFMGLDAVLLFFNIDFKTADYWICNLISGCMVSGIDHDFFMRGLAAAAFWIIASVVTGIFHIKTADVK